MIHKAENIFKYCPKCGEQGFSLSLQGGTFHCGVCKFHYHLNAAAAVAALIVDENKNLLVVERGREPAKGMLDLPGGFVDIGERAEDALQREIREELNLEIKQFSLLTTFPNDYPYGDMLYFTLDLAFVCQVRDFSKIRTADDVSGHQFIPLHEIDLDLFGFESVKKIIEYFKNSSTLQVS